MTYKAWLGIALVVGVIGLGYVQYKNWVHDKENAPNITAVRVGTSIDDAGVVEKEQETFSPTDPVFATVATERIPVGAVLRFQAVYMASGQTLMDRTLTFENPFDTFSTFFQFQTNEGLPKGTYTLHVSIIGENGRVTSEFSKDIVVQ